MTAFTEISVATYGEAAEAVAEVLRPFAYQEGVVLEQLGHADDPDPEAMEPAITVKIYVPHEEDTPALRQRIEEILYHLNRLYPVPSPSYKVLQETDWANAWKEHYHPFRIGQRIWIRPTRYDEEEVIEKSDEAVDDENVILVLDPGMAFGTGLHPTTQIASVPWKKLSKMVIRC
jgi:ribosomal protein L11 methyltransferase